MTERLYLAPAHNIYQKTVDNDPYSGVPANKSVDLAKWITSAIIDGTIEINTNNGIITFSMYYNDNVLYLTIGNVTHSIVLPDKDQQTLSLSGNDISISNGNTINLDISNLNLDQEVTIGEVILNNTNTLSELVAQLDKYKKYDYKKHTQTIPASIWSINTGLNRECAISVMDPYGNDIGCDIIRNQTDPNLITLIFSSPQAGVALFN